MLPADTLTTALFLVWLTLLLLIALLLLLAVRTPKRTREAAQRHVDDGGLRSRHHRTPSQPALGHVHTHAHQVPQFPKIAAIHPDDVEQYFVLRAPDMFAAHRALGADEPATAGGTRAPLEPQPDASVEASAPSSHGQGLREELLPLPPEQPS